MKISIKPEWSATQKAGLHRWLNAVLVNSKLESSVAFPLNGAVTLYVSGRPVWVHAGPWQLLDSSIYVGGTGRRASGAEPLSGAQRLAVVAQFITLLDAWDEYMQPFAAIVSKALLEQYNELKESMAGLVNATVPATGLAFNQSQGLLAAQMDGAWYSPNGEEAKVEGENWTVIQ